MHLAPIRLKLGDAVGMPIIELGRSILAGCKRSTHLARVYTIRAVRELDDKHPNVSLGQHVDDISNLVVARTENELVTRAVQSNVSQMPSAWKSPVNAWRSQTPKPPTELQRHCKASTSR